MLSLLDRRYDDVYKPGELREEANEKAKAAAKNAEPEIGMTKSEVLNDEWDEPDEKNVDECAWVTSEFWSSVNLAGNETGPSSACLRWV